MKKYRWNKERFAINILKLQSIALLALSFDVMFLYALFRQEGIWNFVIGLE